MTDEQAQALEDAAKAATRLQDYLDDFDRNNADDHENDCFERGQDELIEVPAENLRTLLSTSRAQEARIAELEGGRDACPYLSEQFGKYRDDHDIIDAIMEKAVAEARARLRETRLAEQSAALALAVEGLKEIEAVDYPVAQEVANVTEVMALVARCRIIAHEALARLSGEKGE